MKNIRLFLPLFLMSLLIISCSKDETEVDMMDPPEVDPCSLIECPVDSECNDGVCECLDGFTGDNCQFSKITDSLALVTIYNAGKGNTWHVPWNLNEPLKNWHNVKLNENDRVSELIVSTDHIAGTLPADIGNLTELEYLRIWAALLEDDGFIDTLSNLVNLTKLDIEVSSIGGEIPTDIGKLINLRSLTLNQSEFTGTIPSTIGNLIKLNTLAIGGNKIKDPIPESISNLTNLTDLYLGQNDFTMEIPAFLGTMMSLRELKIPYSKLSGSIPASIWSLENLDLLDFKSNRLTGQISPQISKLKKLKWLDLEANKLNGQIPEEVGSLPNIERIILGYNDFTGSIPQSFGENIGIERVEIFYNNLSGCIPISISESDRFCPENSGSHFQAFANPLLPWEGNIYPFCDAPNDQVGSPCRNGNKDGIIDENCNCVI